MDPTTCMLPEFKDKDLLFEKYVPNRRLQKKSNGLNSGSKTNTL